MNNKLKQITDETFALLLKKDVVLPSNYMKCFDKQAKIMNLKLNDKKFTKEISDFMLNEFNDINRYIDNSVNNIKKLENTTLLVKEAIMNKDLDLISELYDAIDAIYLDVKDLSNEIFKDEISQQYNKKWLYHKYLNKDTSFKDNISFVLVKSVKYFYINEKYGELISNNLIKYIISTIEQKLKSKNLKSKIVRYFEDNFLIFLEDSDVRNIEMLFNNMKVLLDDTVLKSKTGILIKPFIDYSINRYSENYIFHNALEDLSNNISMNAKKQ